MHETDLLSIIKLQVVCEAANAVLVQGSADVAGQKQLGIGELSLHLRHFHIVLTPDPTYIKYYLLNLSKKK